MRTVSGAFAALAALLLVLCGCAPSGPRPSSTPGPSPTPIFATEADALAAATDAYAAYVRVSDQILMDGGANPDRIREVATGLQLKADLKGYKTAAQNQVHSTGGTTFDNLTLQRYDPASADGTGIVSIYVCEDISNVDVLDRNGSSVVSANRPDRVQYQVDFDVPRFDRDSLLVSHKEPWAAAC